MPDPKEVSLPTLVDCLDHTVPRYQHRVSRLVQKTRFLQLLQDEDATPVDRHRLLSCSGPVAGAWLNGPPVRKDLALIPATFVSGVRYHLNIMPKCLEPLRDTRLTCACGQWHDPSDPRNILCCRRAGGGTWIRRHDTVKFKFVDIAKSAGHSVSVERHVNEHGFERSDVSVNDFAPSWSSVHEPAFRVRAEFDFAITDPTSATNVKRRCTQGIAATKYAEKKVKESVNKGIHPPDIFIPAIVETYGLFHIELRKALSSIAENHIYQSNSDAGFSDSEWSALKGATLSGYYQLLSVAAVRGVVESMNRAAWRILIRHGKRVDGGRRHSMRKTRNV